MHPLEFDWLDRRMEPGKVGMILGGVMFRSVKGLAVATVAALLAIAPAVADINAFNKKVMAGDFKAAAAEALATWPMLNKSRRDISIIAREFGFAAYMAGDYEAAMTFAGFAAANEPVGPDADPQRATAMVLAKLAQHRQKPTPATRSELFSALTARASWPTLDMVTYLGLVATLAHDFEQGKWKDAQASSELAERLTAEADQLYELGNRRFRLFNGVATYMASKDKVAFDKLTTLVESMVKDIDAATTEEEAVSFTNVYWEAYAWQQAIGLHLVGRRKMKWPEPDKNAKPPPRSERQVRLLGRQSNAEVCSTKIDMRKDLSYPSSALYKGLIGVVVLRVDLDEKGAASNPEVLSAVPEKYFGEAVLKSVKNIRYVPAKPWNESCSLAAKGRVITFNFTVG